MTAFNKGERQSAFFIFLIFFVISTVLITVTVFFGLQVPTNENKLMKAQIEGLQKEQVFLTNFSSKMSETIAYLDNINKPGIQNAEVINGRIGANIDTLTRQIGSDTTARSRMFSDIVTSLQQLKSAKKTLRESSTDSKDASYYKDQAEKAKQDLAACQRDIASLAKRP